MTSYIKENAGRFYRQFILFCVHFVFSLVCFTNRPSPLDPLGPLPTTSAYSTTTSLYDITSTTFQYPSSESSTWTGFLSNDSESTNPSQDFISFVTTESMLNGSRLEPKRVTTSYEKAVQDRAEKLCDLMKVPSSSLNPRHR